MKKLIKVFVISMLITLTIGGTVSARQIDSFSHFRITTAWAETRQLTKAKNDSQYVINLELSRGLNINVKNRLVNSNDDARSYDNLSECGYRYSYDNWAQAGYFYSLQMARQNWWDGAAYIDGSWSPDES